MALAVIAPEGLLLAAVVAPMHVARLRPALQPLLDVLPLLVLIAGVGLSWRFRRPRIFLGLVLLALIDQALQQPPGPVARGIIGLNLPIAFAVLAVGEGGFESVRGRVALLIVSVQTLAIAGVVGSLTALPAFVTFPLLPEPLASRVALPSLAIVLFVLAMMALATFVAITRDRIARGFLWSLPAAFMGFAIAGDRTAYLAIAGLVLVVAIVEEAYALAYRDALTQLPSRRAFDDAAKRLRPPYTVALLDVDHFKKVNDTHGHDVGDQVLRMVAGHLQHIELGGSAYRYGGEEFAILFPGKRIEDCEMSLEQLRANIGDDAFALRSEKRPKKRPKAPERESDPSLLSVTVSIGVAQGSENAARITDVVANADQALYRAKEQGRDRVVTERRKNWRRSGRL